MWDDFIINLKKVKFNRIKQVLANKILEKQKIVHNGKYVKLLLGSIVKSSHTVIIMVALNVVLIIITLGK